MSYLTDHVSATMWLRGDSAASRASLGTLRRLWRQWRQRSFERRQAARFSDRELRDVGLTRGDIYREFSRPFWRS